VRSPGRPRPLRGPALIAAGTLLTAGCTATVPVPPAPGAADPACATIVLALPRDLGDLPRLRTTSQATVAWGEPRTPVVLRCGVEPPGPTTDRCVTVDDGQVAVDWVVVPGPEQEDGTADLTMTTYGRVPAVEVRIPAATRSTDFVVDMGPAVDRVEATRSCL
jgi:hypothetical protein